MPESEGLDAVAIFCCKQADPWLVPLDVYSLGRKKCCHGNLDPPASVHVSAHREVKGGQGADAKLPQERLLGLPGAVGPLLSTCTEGRTTQNLGDPYTPNYITSLTFITALTKYSRQTTWERRVFYFILFLSHSLR